MSHEYFVEPLQTFAVVWMLYILVRARHRRVALTVAQIAAAVGLGLLAKLSTPLYMLAPVVLAIAIARRRTRLGGTPWWHAASVVSSAIGAVLIWIGVLTWYGINWRAARAHADTLNSTLYGPKASLASKLGWWLPHFDAATFLPVVDRLIGVAVAIALIVVASRKVRPATDALAVISAAAVTVAIVIGVLALHPVNEIRYTMPLVHASCWWLLALYH